MQYYYLRKELAFIKNIATCRTDIFKLHYSDITKMTGIPQSTMATYETESNSVTPYLSTAAKIADMYSATLDELCSVPMDFNINGSLYYMSHFITRFKSVDSAKYREQVKALIDDTSVLTKYDVLKMVKDSFNFIIDELCSEDAIKRLDDHTDDVLRFTYNYNRLMEISGISYRKLADACSIGMGTLTKLKKGSEPSLSIVIKLSDFFGVSMYELCRDDPVFFPEKICKETADKKIIANKEDVIEFKEYEKVYKMKNDQLSSKEEAYCEAEAAFDMIERKTRQ